MEYGIRERVVMFDAGFGSILGVVFVLGAAFGELDETEYAAPATDIVLAVLGLILIGFAVLLAQVVARDGVTDGVLRGLATGNVVCAVILLAWRLLADGFGTGGSIVVWVTVGSLLLLALMQVQAAGLRR